VERSVCVPNSIELANQISLVSQKLSAEKVKKLCKYLFQAVVVILIREFICGPYFFLKKKIKLASIFLFTPSRSELLKYQVSLRF
jgi:hypothetical protein